MKKYIPNLLTFANLCLGVFSILEVIKGNYIGSAACIMLAAFIDRYDGRIARRLNACSAIGKELDSLADLVSFGVAPALLIFHKFNFVDLDISQAAGSGLLMLYIICAAYRLAKYNITKFEGAFTGVPITVAGFIFSVYSLLVPINRISTVIAVVLLLILSFLMVSKFNFKKI